MHPFLSYFLLVSLRYLRRSICVATLAKLQRRDWCESLANWPNISICGETLLRGEQKRIPLEYDDQIDARGLACPEPLMLVKHRVRGLAGGEVLHVLATDPTTERDFEHFCQFMKHEYLKVDRGGWQGDGQVLQFWIRKRG